MPGNEAEASLYLEVAKGQCLAFAPLSDGATTETAVIPFGPFPVEAFVIVDGHPSMYPTPGGIRGTLTLTRTANVVQADFDSVWSITPNPVVAANPGKSGYRFETESINDLIPAAFASDSGDIPDDLYRSGGNITFNVFDGTTVSWWLLDDNSPEMDGLEHVAKASFAWTTPAPSTGSPVIPENYFLAIITQARNLKNAGVSPVAGGEFDGSGYGVSVFPLDWTVKQLLRPERGLGAIV